MALRPAARDLRPADALVCLSLCFDVGGQPSIAHTRRRVLALGRWGTGARVTCAVTQLSSFGAGSGTRAGGWGGGWGGSCDLAGAAVGGGGAAAGRRQAPAVVHRQGSQAGSNVRQPMTEIFNYNRPQPTHTDSKLSACRPPQCAGRHCTAVATGAARRLGQTWQLPSSWCGPGGAPG